MRACILLLPLLLLLGGCYAEGNHQVEINQDAGQILPVSALAIARQENGYRMTVESIRQDSLDGDAAPAYFMVEAADFDALFVRADALLSSRLYLSHALVIVVSEEVARDGLAALADSLLARPDARLTLRVAVAVGASPDQILRAESVTEGIPGLALAALLDKRASDGTLADCPLFRILDAQASGRAFSLPILTPNVDGHTAPGGNLPFFPGGEARA